MPGPNTDISFVDGSFDFSGGVKSLKIRTVASERTPNGLRRNELAWLINGRTRDGGLAPRAGWQQLSRIVDNGLFQGGAFYSPSNDFPYLLLSISGEIYKVVIQPDIIIQNLSATFGLVNPAAERYSYFEQAEEFMVIQAGDGLTLPLFWDGITLRRSIGITNTAVAPGTPGVNEIPAAGPMHYYMGRLWYAQGKTLSAGDIVRGPSGTVPYDRRDSVLNVTENPMVLSGDGFTLPTASGEIRALQSTAAIDVALGQGKLYIFTRKSAYALQVPVTRADWIAADSQNAPLLTVVQHVNGAVNDRSIVAVNGDLFFRSLEPGIRSLILALRDFKQWANVDLSADVRRLIQYDDRELLRFSSGIEFDNRLLQTALPKETDQGVVFQAVVPLDFMPVSTLETQRPPAWQGSWEGLDFLNLYKADFGGRERAFGLIVSRIDGSINLWELTYASRREAGDNRVTMIAELPAYHGDNEAMLKRLMGGELWVDRIHGTVYFKVEYRPDGENCWLPWHQWTLCSPRDSSEAEIDTGYPTVEEEFGECYAAPVGLPKPPAVCQDCGGINNRPSDIGYQFQVRLTMKGNARVTRFLIHCSPMERGMYSNLPPCNFAEFPSVIQQAEYINISPGGSVDFDVPIPPIPEEEGDMPLQHAIYVPEHDAIFGVYGGVLRVFNPETGDMTDSVRYAVPDFGPSFVAYSQVDDRLYMAYWHDALAIESPSGAFGNVPNYESNVKGLYKINPATLVAEFINLVTYMPAPGVDEYWKEYHGPRNLIYSGDRLWVQSNVSSDSSGSIVHRVNPANLVDTQNAVSVGSVNRIIGLAASPDSNHIAVCETDESSIQLTRKDTGIAWDIDGIYVYSPYRCHDVCAVGNLTYYAATRSQNLVKAVFSVANDGQVRVAVRQSDGKIVISAGIGGNGWLIGGITRYNARLNADGTIDATWAAPADLVFQCAAVQADDKIVIGGAFTDVGGTARVRLARLNADGTLDTYQDTLAGATGGNVLCIALQADGKAVIGGSFTSVNGVARGRVARMETDGTLDATFANPAVPNNQVNTVAIQADGKIVIGGTFTSYGGAGRSRLARISDLGVHENGWILTPGVNSTVESLAIQAADQSIVITGAFTSVLGVSKRGLARITSAGALDAAFLDAGGGVAGTGYKVIVDATHVAVAGSFTQVGKTDNPLTGDDVFSPSVYRSRVARFAIADGTPDAAFNANIQNEGSNIAYDLLVIGTDLLISGAFQLVAAANNPRIVQVVLATGAIDAGFTSGLAGGPSTSVISMGDANLRPIRVRYNPVDGLIYVPCMATGQVVVVDPATDTVVETKTGFTDPIDVVFTATRKFAVQQSGRALKEIT